MITLSIIIAEGKKNTLERFVQSLQTDKPYLARYEEFSVLWEHYQGEFDDFQILKSSENKLGGVSYLPPDISICDDCLQDMKNIKDSRFQYAFTSCAICGPRYTTIGNIIKAEKFSDL